MSGISGARRVVVTRLDGPELDLRRRIAAAILVTRARQEHWQSSRACRKGQIGSSSRQESMAAAEAAEVMQLKRGSWTSGRGVSRKDGRSGLQLIKNKPASNQQLQRQAWSLN